MCVCVCLSVRERRRRGSSQTGGIKVRATPPADATAAPIKKIKTRRLPLSDSDGHKESLFCLAASRITEKPGAAPEKEGRKITNRLLLLLRAEFSFVF